MLERIFDQVSERYGQEHDSHVPHMAPKDPTESTATVLMESEFLVVLGSTILPIAS